MSPRATRPRTASVPRTVTAPPSDAPDLSQAPLDAFTLALPPRTLVAPNFRLYELSKSETASRRGIDNRFETLQQLQAAVHLARQVLQPLRDWHQQSFSPNSVFRSQKLERAMKNKPASWISTSQHARGEACDVELSGIATLELARWAKTNLADFDQIICECYDPAQGPNSGWVHISLKAPGCGANRRQCLSYVRDPASNRLVYVTGLQATA